MSIAVPHPPAARPAPAVQTPGRTAHRLSLALAVATVAGAVPTAVVDGVLLGPPAMNGSARGTALVMFVVAVPALLAGARASAAGHAAGLPVWLGSAAYLLYNAVMLLFGTPFNALFLPYVAICSLALWTVVTVAHGADLAAFPGPARRTERVIACYVWVVVALNALAWLRGAVPGMLDPRSPAFLAGTGLATSPTYVQDLAVWLPLAAAAAWWLWRGLARGRVAVAAILVFWTVESIGVAVDQAMGSAADPSSPAVAAAAVPLFVVSAVTSLVPAVVMLRAAGRRSDRGGAAGA
jgi:hypothetical protein